MKILILGSGGREHALATKLAASAQIEEVVVAPGNAGMLFSQKISIQPLDLNDRQKVLGFAQEVAPLLTIIGPEAPLVAGLVDFLEEHGFVVFGPNQKAAQLEGSKIFSKQFMQEFAIPTAKAESYASYAEAQAGLKNWDIAAGIVLKADSLAAGKGVVVTSDPQVAATTITNFMANPNYPVHTQRLLIEEEVKGKEISAFAICDGENFVTFGFASDYKRLEDFDRGPNTGGMGGYADKNSLDQSTMQKIEREVFARTMQGMKKRGTPFKGVLFAGLMIDDQDISVLEYNVRFGDPETQILLPLFQGDLFKVLHLAAQGKLHQLAAQELSISDEVSVHIVMVSNHYPALDGTPMELNRPIEFPQALCADSSGMRDKYLYFSGVKRNPEGALVNAGGRVLGVTALGQNLQEARDLAYQTLAGIHFENSRWRKDIGILR